MTPTLWTQADLFVRPYDTADRESVTALLDDLPRLYPGGSSWLSARLTDCSDGRARCSLIEQDGRLIAASIETPKPAGAIKLSTFFVDANYRNGGVGSHLARHLRARWSREGACEAYVTCDETVVCALSGVLVPLGFMESAALPNRYRQGATEVVLRALL